jgi:hypothetical protein
MVFYKSFRIWILVSLPLIAVYTRARGPVQAIVAHGLPAGHAVLHGRTSADVARADELQTLSSPMVVSLSA